MNSTSFIKALSAFFPPERFKTRSIDLYAYASDAGFYEIVPIAVCFPKNEAEITEIIKQGVLCDVPLTFRAGGTSLSGQTVGEGVIVDLSRAWKNVEVIYPTPTLPNGEGVVPLSFGEGLGERSGEREGSVFVRVQPGVTGGVVNQYLKLKNRKIGPDPSSINSAMMGGILSNNASGMCCGVKYNSYHTVKSLRFILADGKSYDTTQASDYERFEREQYKIFTKLAELKNQITNNESLITLIRDKYQIKNTVGYGLNSFLDYEHPLDILAHLLIGAEGTLAFIAEAVLETLPDKPCKATALLVFENINDACLAITPLKELGAESLELMDRASLRSVENMKGLPEYVKRLSESAAALLCEFQTFSADDLDVFIAQAKSLQLPVIQELNFTKETEEQILLWKIRKGMFPAVGAVRAKGTTVVLEDIAFPLPSLAAAVADLEVLFKKFEYHDAIIFGHAKDGNLHFVITQSFDTKDQIDRYALFMDKVVDLVVHKYKGSLKAEHGTGRNMAPFVKTEWGDEAYQIMKALKKVIDPFNIFNRGVIINTDELLHLKNLKKTPVVEDEVDKCIECGFCEQACPSRNLTLSPRKRIVIRRAQQRLLQAGNSAKASELELYYHYDGLETCAVDGMCASDCPVQINTGDLVKKLRKKEHTFIENGLAKLVVNNLKTTEKALRFGLKTFDKTRNIIGNWGMLKNIPNSVRPTMFNPSPTLPEGEGVVPLSFGEGFGVRSEYSHPVGEGSGVRSESADFLVFTSCVSRLMTNQDVHDVDYLKYIAKQLKFNLKVLPLNSGLCCGQAFSSKGFEAASLTAQKNSVDQLLQLTDNGRLPILVDVSSCSQYFLHYNFTDKAYQEKYRKLRFLDSVDFVHDHILPKLQNVQKLESLTLHPNCSLHKMNKLSKYKKIAETLANEVHIPIYATCCGMAGDRGFTVPELTASAVHMQVEEVQQINAKHHCSTSVTCNINLSTQTGKQYESLYALVHKVV